MSERIQVLLADDHPAIRAGIRAAVDAEDDMELVGEASDGNEARRLCERLRPDVMMLDISMPGPPAAATADWVRQRCPGARVVVLSAYDEDAYVHGLMAVGVSGYVLKQEALESLVRAVRSVVKGDTWFSRRIVDKLARWKRTELIEGDHPRVSERELAVVRLLVLGKTDREIGQELCIAERTVRHYVHNMCDKLGVNSRIEVIVRVVQMDLLHK